MNKSKISVVISLIIIVLTTSSCINSFRRTFASNEKIRKELWEQKKYKEAIEVMLSVYDDYKELDEKEQSKNKWIVQGLIYNIACGYSLIDDKEKSLEYLKLSYDNGYKNYYNVIKDKDLDNIRTEKGYKSILSRFKEVGDYKYILKKSSSYSNVEVDSLNFVYQKSEELKSLREKYELDSIAGKGDEFSKIVNLMSWVNHIVRHDGSSMNPQNKRADALIRICKKENRGINCRMMATILNEVYLSMGFKSRFITCLPKGEKFNDCHVINIVYSNQYNKWLWMDPSFEAFVMDSNNTPLSIQEVRNNICNNIPMKVYDKIHWNDQEYPGGAKRYLHEYMSKNLYRFSCTLSSESAMESSGKKITYIELYPEGYNPGNRELSKIFVLDDRDMCILTNDKQFWALPNG